MKKLKLDILDKFIEIEKLIQHEDLTKEQILIIKYELKDNLSNTIEYIDELMDKNK